MGRNNKKWEVTQRVASNIIVVFFGVAFYLALSNFDAVRRVVGIFVSHFALFSGYCDCISSGRPGTLLPQASI